MCCSSVAHFFHMILISLFYGMTSIPCSLTLHYEPHSYFSSSFDNSHWVSHHYNWFVLYFLSLLLHMLFSLMPCFGLSHHSYHLHIINSHFNLHHLLLHFKPTISQKRDVDVCPHLTHIIFVSICISVFPSLGKQFLSL